MRGAILLALMLVPFLAGPAAAQGIECGKVRTTAERTICASPALLGLDRQVSAAYAAAVARQPDQAAALRQRALDWVRERDAVCTGSAAQIGPCLSAQMTARLGALAPASAPQLAAAALPQVPSADNPPAPAATVEPGVVQAARQADATLVVASPGRFAITARSTSGVALQLVDMLTGPGDLVGEAGVKDGRLDALLDVGTYRLRSFAAAGAAEQVQLAAAPFQDAAPPAALPPPGQTASAELRDLEQRGFWLLVPPSGELRIEAAGRALADLRLWRGGRELAALAPAASMIEPQPGHPMLDLRLEGKVEPGVYLAMAYGGPPLPWADGASAMPFHARAGLSPALAEGWTGGEIGPFGSERYAAPAFAGVFRLDLPQPAEAELRVGAERALLTRTSREPRLAWRGTPGRAADVEIRGAAGQAFTLRAIEPPGSMTLSRPGTYFLSAVALGAGGDAPPPTVLLLREEPRGPARILAGNVPRLTAGQAWRGQFNLRGPVALLFENAVGGPVSVRSTGVALGAAAGIQPYDIPADYYVLRLNPAPGAQGVIDVTVGAPTAAAAPAAPLPPDPAIPLGVHTVSAGQSLRLSAQAGPGMSTGLSARPVPVALAEGPLAITQAAGSGPVTVPVALAAGGTLSATEIGGGLVQVQQGPGQVVVPGAERARTVMLAWRRTESPPASIPRPPAAEAGAPLDPAAPVPFDLVRGEQRGFALTVPDGGLYRVETLGRLRTAGRMATAFIPALAQAEANGTGQNMLLQQWLRAGRYRVNVTAVDSAGHLAVAAGLAPLQQGAALHPGGSVRTSLAAGEGVAFPVLIAQPGRYRLELAGLGRPFTARLDDAEGWPVTKPGEISELEQSLQPGRYRLLVSPDAVARQVAARLTPVLLQVVIEGHGPHRMPFAETQRATWREPPGRADARVPDVWTFSLAGPADVTLRVGEGMVAALSQDGRPLVRIAKRWAGKLEAGAYRVEATSLGRNDRLDYTLLLEAKQLQPGQVRTVTLPASIPFALAEARVASLTTWGVTPAKAMLRRSDGTEIVRVGARADDWNIALSRPLPAGSYRLDLSAATPPEGRAAADEPERDSEEGDAPEGDDQAAQSPPRRETSASRGERPDTPEPNVEVRLDLPERLAAAAPEPGPLAGAGVHVFRVPQQPGPGMLVVARAQSSGGAVLTLERQDQEGWRVVALDEGRSPLVAALGDGDPRPWRVEAWTLDGGAAEISSSVQTLAREAQSPGTVALQDQDGVAAARVRLAGSGVLSVRGAAVLAAGWPGHAAEPIESGQTVAQGDELWLVGRQAGTEAVAPLEIDGTAVVQVPGGGAAVLPGQSPVPGRIRLWRADSGFGQPGLTAGGVAAGSAVALARHGTALRNAGGAESLRAQVGLLDLALLPEQGPGPLTVPPGSAVPVRLAAPGEVALTLAPGLAAFIAEAAVWGGGEPVSRSVFAEREVLLANLGAVAAPALVQWQAADRPEPVRPGGVFKRFFGASGSFELAVSAGQLAVAGDADLLWQSSDGLVQRGRDITADQPGRVVVSHKAGAVVLSLAGEGASPWPPAQAQAVALPARLTLAGAAMELGFTAETPVLLHAVTTAPVLLGVGAAAPELFAAGAEFHRAVPAGAVRLRVYSPHDGPLSGTLALHTQPITPVSEGLGQAVAVAPGGSAAFGFSLARAATVGLGIRAEPDQAEVRLLDASGSVLGEGVAQLRPLRPGFYVIEARVPPDAAPSLVRPAVLGITPRGSGPPPEVAQRYLELVGLKPVDGTR